MTDDKFRNFSVLGSHGYSDKADILKVRFRNRPDGIEYAILKKFSRVHKSHQREGEISLQISKLHSSFVNCYAHYSLDREYYILYEFCGNGNLKSEISRRRKIRRFWTEDDMITICEQLFEAMSCMHAAMLVHGDIKPDNLFITESDQIKIGDFGTGKQKIKTLQTTSLMGTATYLPPEFIEAYMTVIDPRLKLDLTKVDIWCFGRVIAEMSCLKFLRKLKVDDQEQLNSDLNKALDSTEMSTSFRNLIIKMHRVEPSLRPSFAELLRELAVIKGVLSSAHLTDLSITEVRTHVRQCEEETKEQRPLYKPPELITLGCSHRIPLDEITSHLSHKLFIDDLKCLKCSAQIPYTYLKSLSHPTIEHSLDYNLKLKHKSKCPKCGEVHEVTRLDKYYLAFPIKCVCQTSFCSLCLKHPPHRIICGKRKMLD
jgi:serine/threonine protein kinase